MIVQELISLFGFKVDEASINTLEKRAGSVISKMQGVGLKLGLFLTAPLTLIGRAAIKSTAEMENQLIAFETLLQSAEKAKILMSDLVNMAALTPFELTDLTEASKKLLSYGIENEKLLPTLKMLGDISLGNKDKFDRLALAYGQVSAKGRLMGQETLQMVETGFNPLQVISDMTGESMAELSKKMEKGQISAAMVGEALKKATSEGYRFFNGMEKASQTFTGRSSTLRDYVMAGLRSLVVDIFPVLKRGVDYLITLTEKFNGLSQGIKTGVAILGILLAIISPLILGFTTLSAVGLFFIKVLNGISVAAARANVSLGVLLGLSLGYVAAIIAGIALLLLAFDDVYTYLNGGESFIGKFLAPWVELAPKIREKILPYWYMFVDTISGMVDIIKNVFGFIYNIIDGNSKAASENIKNIVYGILKVIQSVLGILGLLIWNSLQLLFMMFSKWLWDALAVMGKTILTALMGLGQSIYTMVIDIFNKIWDTLKEKPLVKLFTKGFKMAGEGLGVLPDMVSNGLSAMSSGMRGAPGMFMEGVNNATGKTTVEKNLNITMSPSIAIPVGTPEQQKEILKSQSEEIFTKGLEALTRQLSMVGGN